MTEASNLLQNSSVQHFPLSTLVLNRINLASSLPVSSALTKFSHLPNPPNSPYIQLSDIPATLFTSPDDISSSFDTWLQLPVPNVLHRTDIRNALAKASEELPGLELSLEVTYGSHHVYLPVWILNLWPRLGTLVFHCREWASARSNLLKVASTSYEMELLAQELLRQLSFIPLDSTVPQLNPFRSSHLPGLILDTWLSDDHINAGCDFINTHPNCPSYLRVLHSFFLGSLSLRFQPNASASRRRILPLDVSIADGVINELLIPVHRPSHWALLYIDLVTRQYVYIDSLSPNTNSVPPSCINPVNAWLTEILNRDVVLRPGVRPFMLDEQSDSHSCGVAVLSSMAHYALGGDFVPWFQHRAKVHRLHWALTLFNPSHNLVSNDTESIFDVDPSDLEDDRFTPEVVFEDAAPTSPLCNPSMTGFTMDTLGSLDTLLSDTNSDSPIPIATSTSHHSCATKQPLVQSTLPFKPIPRSEWQAQESRRYHEQREENQREADQLALVKEKQKMLRCEHDRARKRAYCARQRRLRDTILPQDKNQGLDTNTGNDPNPDRRATALLSRPHSAVYRLDNKPPPTESNKHREHTSRTGMHRINWTNRLIWPHIERTAITVGYPWSPVEIVRRLKLLDPTTFSSLCPQRISQWRDHRFPDVLHWTEAHIRSIESGDRPTRVNAGRPGILQNHPSIVQTISNWLLDLRKAGVALDIETIRGYMSGVIRHALPEAFTRCDSSGRVFRCSRVS